MSQDGEVFARSGLMVLNKRHMIRASHCLTKPTTWVIDLIGSYLCATKRGQTLALQMLLKDVYLELSSQSAKTG